MTFYSDADFYPDSSMGYLARRVFQLSTTGLEPVFAPEGITLTQWSALVSIHFDRGGTCAALARDLAHDKGATTRLVDGLVEKGWVRRDRSKSDRRVVHLSLTDEGTAVARRARLKVIDRWNEWLTDWSADDAGELVRLLAKLRDTLDRNMGHLGSDGSACG